MSGHYESDNLTRDAISLHHKILNTDGMMDSEHNARSRDKLGRGPLPKYGGKSSKITIKRKGLDLPKGLTKNGVGQ